MYKFLVQMDVDPDHEKVFHDFYDTEHVPLLMGVNGVKSVQRLVRADELVLNLAGEEQVFHFPYEPRFAAIYEIEDPSVLLSQGWAKAVDAGRWATMVRPFTSNRRHTLHRILKRM